MTIDAGFLKILKKDVCPDAFVSELPARPDTVFIDGQVKLMKSNAITTWSLFVRVQFQSTIRKSFETGADVVVLGFDDYTYVPRSKTMTQQKRNKVQPAMEFSEEDELPKYMPVEWMSAMRNRTFKVKVIKKVIMDVKSWFANMVSTDAEWAERTLVIDFHDMPEVMGRPLAEDRVPEYVKTESFTGRGECDIKAYSWMPVSRCILMDSIDGDYLPLTLLQQERIGMCDAWLRRMVTNVGVKRTAGEAKEGRSREYEFVSVSMIYARLMEVMPSTKQSPIRQFCSLVAMCGCDFALSLPRLGPSTLWTERHHVRNLNLSDPTHMLRALGTMYGHVFVAKGTSASVRDAKDTDAEKMYAQTLKRIQSSSKVSQRIREALWTPERAAAHTQNVAWTMLYWTLLQQCPDPLSGEFGYTRDAKGRTQFAFAT